MARVTVEDCVKKIPNRFELVMLASQRARDISAGAQETVERDNDKNAVVALREIADETIPLGEVRESVIKGLQKHLPFDDFEEEETTMSVFGESVGLTVEEGAAEPAVEAEPAAEVESEAEGESEAEAEPEAEGESKAKDEPAATDDSEED